MKQKNNSASAPNDEKNRQRTNKQKKFLKKPKNKTAKKQFFKELEQHLREGLETAEKLVKNDLETFSKILEFADISKELDVNILRALLSALPKSISEDLVEDFYNLARHNVLVILFKLMIVLKEKILTDYKKSQIILLRGIFTFFNIYLGLKRVQKLLRNTEGFEKISQPGFWAPIYSSPTIRDIVTLHSLWFSVRISQQNSFTEKFVENYVAIARKGAVVATQIYDPKALREILQSISQIILESEQGGFFLKLVSDLPEKSFLIPTESDAEKFKSDVICGNIRALVKCANCGIFEKTQKQFQKCSRCGFAFYCSKVCQRNDWQNHKQICKEIKKQN